MTNVSINMTVKVSWTILLTAEFLCSSSMSEMARPRTRFIRTTDMSNTKMTKMILAILEMINTDILEHG
jgi:hypothetical protein